METTKREYHYEIITEKQTDLIEKAADCITQAFVGIDVLGKWVQDPMLGELKMSYETFYPFVKESLEAAVSHGYTAIAQDMNQRVVGVLFGDTNALEVIGEDVFDGDLVDMNVVLHALEDVDKRFLKDYESRNKTIKDGELLHILMIAVTAEHDRHEIIKQSGNKLLTKASSQGLKLVLAECAGPKSTRVMEKYYGMEKYEDLAGNHIVHKYKENNRLNGIPTSVAEGIYILTREL